MQEDAGPFRVEPFQAFDQSQFVPRLTQFPRLRLRFCLYRSTIYYVFRKCLCLICFVGLQKHTVMSFSNPIPDKKRKHMSLSLYDRLCVVEKLEKGASVSSICGLPIWDCQTVSDI